ncbi:MAG: sugar transferase [Thermanaerothrix sp.]|nr:sugar transferase [Thermanaerothrix sp.]
MYRRFLKRPLDLALVLISLPLTLPLMAVTALMVGICLGKPVIFKQERAGLNGRPFKLYKFRTMTDAKGPSGELLPDEVRLTRFGRFLRSTSLDELPELFNVLKGDMSIVGPRPLPTSYLSRYSPFQMRRHEVMPGITGWAQVNGRNALCWERRFEMDVWYVDNLSFLLDLKIILLTMIKVALREGISQEGHATMEEFKGEGDREHIPPL